MKKVLLIAAGLLLLLILLLLAGGPILNALGLEVYCLTDADGRWRLVRCDDSEQLTADADPPTLAADAQPTLIDTDMAVDDWLAILYLLQRPDVDVRAVTVTGAGEARCGPGVRNALNLVALAGRSAIPVTCGRATPLAGERTFPTSWRDDVDDLAGLTIPANPSRPASAGARELIASTIRDAGGELEIIALGPLTNLADLFLQEPSLAGEIEQLYIMGGAFSVPGNVSDAPEMAIDNEVAEWNIYVDPRAAGVVVASGAPITFVPLDASLHVPLDQAFYDRLKRNRATPEAEFVYRALTENIGFVRSGDYYFWDPLTAAIAVDETLGVFENQPVAVVEGEGPQSGATVVQEDGDQVRFATAADAGRFRQQFLDVLNGLLP